MQGSSAQEAQDELTNLMTVMYMMIQHAIVYPEELVTLHTQLGKLLFSPCMDHRLMIC